MCSSWSALAHAGVQAETHGAPALIAADDGYFRHTSMPRYAAVASPVFRLRTRNSVGSGEFLDIKALVDICSATGVPQPEHEQ